MQYRYRYTYQVLYLPLQVGTLLSKNPRSLNYLTLPSTILTRATLTMGVSRQTSLQAKQVSILSAHLAQQVWPLEHTILGLLSSPSPAGLE